MEIQSLCSGTDLVLLTQERFFSQGSFVPLVVLNIDLPLRGIACLK